MAINDLINISDRSEKEFEEFKTKLLKSGQTNIYTPDDYYNRLFKNKQFIDRYGEEFFKEVEDPDARDNIFRNDILEEELSRYSDDPNLNTILNMTPEGQVDLLQSGYLSPKERSAETLSSGKYDDETKKSIRGAAGSDLLSNIGGYALAGAGTGGFFGAGFGAVGAFPGALVGGAVGALTGLGVSVYNYFNPENYADELHQTNESILQEAIVRDVDRKRNSDEVKEASTGFSSNIKAGLSDGSIAYDQVDELFDNIVGNHGTDEKPSYGSNYYQAFKDSHLKDLDEDTKIQIVSDFMAMQRYYPNDTFTGIDQVFQNIVADRQGVGEKTSIVVKRNAIGLAGNFAQIPTALIAEGIQLTMGDEAAEKYLNSETPIIGPAYWNKATKYNLITPEAIAKADRLGGVSDALDIMRTDESQWNVGNMINESLGQMHYLAYYALAGKAFGKFGKGIDMTSKAGTAYKAAATIVPNLSMSSQMAYEAYSDAQENLMAKYNSVLAEDLNNRINKELDNIDWDTELYNYKSYHRREGERITASDEDIIDMLKQQKAADLAEQLAPQVEADNRDVLNQARTQALDAFRTEAVMDLLKNSLNSTTFRGWMYNSNKELQGAIRNRDLGIRFNGNTAGAAKKPKMLFLRTAGKEMLGEAADEYMDGVTTGMASGFNVAQFDNWLMQRENPESYDNTSMLYSGMVGLSMGIRNAFNKDNLYEASLGAISPILPLFNRSSAKPGSTKRHLLTNAIYEEYVSELEKYTDAEARVQGINDFLVSHEKDISNMANIVSYDEAIESARLSGDTKALKDAQQSRLIYLASIVNSARQNARGATIVDDMMTNLDRLSNDNYTDEEKKQLGNEFINQPENQNSSMTAEDGYNALRDNAKKLLSTADKVNGVEQKINRHPNSELFTDKTRSYLLATALQQEDWEERLNEITKTLGIGNSHSTVLSSNIIADKKDAEIVSSELSTHIDEVTDNINSINKEIDDVDTKLRALNSNSSISIDELSSKSNELNSKKEALLQSKIQLNKEKDRLTSLKNSNDALVNDWNDDRQVLSSSEIISSGARNISYMIENRDKYSTEQRVQIDEAVSTLAKNDPDYKNRLDEAVRTALSLEESTRSYNSVQESPLGFSELINRIDDIKKKTAIKLEANRYKRQLFSLWEALTPEHILSDIHDIANSSMLEEYIKSSGRQDLSDVLEVVKLQESLLKYATNPANAHSIIDITKVAKSRDEAIQALNNVISNKSIPINTREDIEQVLKQSNILDKAKAATFKQEKDEIARKEEERKEIEKIAAEIEAYQLDEANRLADEEAARRASQETIEDNGQEVTEEVDRIETGREPIEQIDEEEVLLDDYTPDTSELPSSSESFERDIEEDSKTGEVTPVSIYDLPPSNDEGLPKEGEFAGNEFSRYRVIDGVVKLREDTESITGDLLAQFKWFDAANIKYQEVIDNELNAISKLNPDVRILRVNSKDNATNDIVMKDINILVVEYTDDIAKIHKNNDSIISANGKKWLVIGGIGSGRRLPQGQRKKLFALTDNKNGIITRRARDYFRNNPTDRFYVVDGVHTKISRINPGRLVREDSNHPAGVQSVSSLLSGTGVKLQDVSWVIETNSGPVIVGRVSENNLLRASSGVSGRVYILIPASGGQKIAAYIKPVFSNELVKDSELSNIINDALARLVNDDHKERFKALKELYQYLYFDKNNNILIGTKDSNVITIVQEGKSETYRLDDPNRSKIDIINQLLQSKFRVQVRRPTLTDRTTLSMYDKAGALMIDLQKYGTSGADFNVYEIDNNTGNPIIPDMAIPVTLGRGSKGQYNGLLYGGGIYREIGNDNYRDFNGNTVTDPKIIRHLGYIKEIREGKAPAEEGGDTYIFDSDINNPVVITVSKSSNSVTELSLDKAIEYINKINSINEERAREDAINEAYEQSFTAEEDVDLTEDTDESLEDFLFGEEDVTIETQAELDKPFIQSEPSDPNSTSNKPSSSNAGISARKILIDNLDRFFDLVDNIWDDVPGTTDEIIEYLRKKNIPVDNITDIDAWFDLFRCR